MSSKRAKAKTTKKRPQRATSNVFAMFDQSQIQEFKEAFNMIDQNRDGFIDKEDLHDMLASLGKNPTDEYLEGMMSEAPGPINFTMFLTMFGEKLNGTDPEDVIRNAFACFDEEASGQQPPERLPQGTHVRAHTHICKRDQAGQDSGPLAPEPETEITHPLVSVSRTIKAELLSGFLPPRLAKTTPTPQAFPLLSPAAGPTHLASALDLSRNQTTSGPSGQQGRETSPHPQSPEGLLPHSWLFPGTGQSSTSRGRFSSSSGTAGAPQACACSG
uniref:Myosin light chain 9 n=1 Tax=Sus scrofa TaxID=9823 RepID=A0A8D1EYC1_PIG